MGSSVEFKQGKAWHFSTILAIIFTAFILPSLTACQKNTSSSTSSAPANDKKTKVSSDSLNTNNKPTLEGKQIIVYFSATGKTEKVAQNLENTLGISRYQIVPETTYTPTDLNWLDEQTRATKEQKDEQARPKISGTLPNLSKVDAVYLGFPLWWAKPPRIVQTFIEQANLSGKTVHIFCTSGPSPIEPALAELKNKYPNIKWQGAKRFAADISSAELTAWVKSLTVNEE